MVCTADDLLEWKDFPKGLRVLLLDEDTTSSEEMRSKLEGMDYTVFTFNSETEALAAIADKSERFHVAIVQVGSSNEDGMYKFLKDVKDLPTIVTSINHCLSTMMQCIALGAVEFLQKPLSDDKLRNIWQHVVHKAFNAGGKDTTKALKPVKESVLSILKLKVDNAMEATEETATGGECSTTLLEMKQEVTMSRDKYPAPSTPQLNQGARTLDDTDSQDPANFSTEGESAKQVEESKSIENSCHCDTGAAEATGQTTPTQPSGQVSVKKEHKSAKSESKCSHNRVRCAHLGDDAAADLNKSACHSSGGTKANKKKMKVDWTPELHKKFVQAVEQLGVDQAIPSRILELMDVEGLTRHNVASHLQKYRMHRRHILPKEDDKRWPHPRDATQRSYYPHNSSMAFPPYHSNHALPGGQVCPAWISPGRYPSGVQIWGSPYYTGWRPNEHWNWKPTSAVYADAWGCPVMQSPHQGSLPWHRNPYGSQNADEMLARGSMQHNSFDLQPIQADEIIDKVVKEAITKPWLPLPLGLKPPSTDSVLNELSRQGISAFPPHHNHDGSHFP